MVVAVAAVVGMCVCVEVGVGWGGVGWVGGVGGGRLADNLPCYRLCEQTAEEGQRASRLRCCDRACSAFVCLPYQLAKCKGQPTTCAPPPPPPPPVRLPQAPGFFPGSGALGARGRGSGRGFALNLPLGDGLRDELFLRAFAELAGGAVEAYNPSCVVLQWWVPAFLSGSATGDARRSSARVT